MHDPESFDPLEERLADEARRMLVDSRSARTCLLAEFVRRRRQRKLAHALCTTAAVLVVGCIAAGWIRRPEHDVVRIEPGEAGRSFVEADVPMVEPRGGTAADVPETISDAAGVPFVAIAILIPQTAENGEPTLVPAWYVPGQDDEIDSRNLSPAERSAMLQLLGPDYDSSTDETI